ncbi:hypothetical protein ABNB59_13335 [Paenibacillus larvae]|nr:hypothetical protein [Paenibacillus larvae]MCY9565358.1 hypothetical protein [Paenibacillus larvae]MCY9565855.1 hypothetical protein [Paenibacillus larvae]MCY9571532.1 hypothetical protein [Paenibacillus larvae]MCY9700927.1 hypothetical protein [Paenibacillus larvae]MCY9709619.1 hypothetical protein [Paenibacillus larvae]
MMMAEALLIRRIHLPEASILPVIPARAKPATIARKPQCMSGKIRLCSLFHIQGTGSDNTDCIQDRMSMRVQ